MNGFLIQKQTQAEKDDYLVECFYDSGILNDLLQSNYSILSGRKGTGKTALAKYLQEKYCDYNLSGSLRIPINSFSHNDDSLKIEEKKERIIVFILLKTAQYLYENGLILEKDINYWKEIFNNIGLKNVEDYQSFHVTKKTAKLGFFTGLLGGHVEEQQEKNQAEIDSSSLFHALSNSINKTTKSIVFIDDLSDYLDYSKKDQMKSELEVVRDILFKFDLFNINLSDKKIGLRFISCIRDDLFEFFEGSNINKLKSNSLSLSWDEKSFSSLLIRRLPYFQDNLKEYLIDPVQSIKKQFPDEIFQDRLVHFDTRRYITSFYAYMVAISFNRPRDFLSFCYAMRNRLSEKHPATIDNLDSAEIEYSDYFRSEIKDEIFLASKIFDFGDTDDDFNKLIDVLAKNDTFNPSQLRSDLAPILHEKTSLGRKRIENFVYQLWIYGLLGFKENKKDGLINFRYINNLVSFIHENANKYIYYLHRGLWWFAQKRKDTRSKGHVI